MQNEDNIQVLITTMNMVDPEFLLQKMNIDTSFVIGNQSTYDSNIEYVWKGKRGVIVTRNEKGVGANRNNTLKYSSAQFCILADDDMCFYDNYSQIVKNAFNSLPNADVLIFNIDEKESNRRRNSRKKRVRLFNYMNYGAARIVFRRASITYNSITFNYNFGGGTKHSSGEDSLFLRECLLHGLRIYTIPESLAHLCDDRDSTWFNGYTSKFLYDEGVFLGVAHPNLSLIFALYLAIRHKEYSTETKSVVKTFLTMAEGIRFVKRRFVQN